MTKNTTYVCDYCGEVFSNEDSCYQHEWKHRFELFKNRIKFMKEENGVFVELPISYEFVDECVIIYCDGTDEAWNTIEEAFYSKGYGCPAEDIRADGHIFVYDYDTNDWFCLEKKLSYFVELSTKINKAIEGK